MTDLSAFAFQPDLIPGSAQSATETRQRGNPTLELLPPGPSSIRRLKVEISPSRDPLLATTHRGAASHLWNR